MWKPAHSNCTLVGSLNPAILGPEWLARQEIVRSPEAEITANVTRGFEISRAVYKNDQYLWAVEPSRLSVEGIEADANPGSFVASVMEKLKHTPVTAVGTNLLFELPAAVGARAWSERYQVKLPGAVADRLLSHEIHHRFEHDTSVATIKMKVADSTVLTADFNFNRTVSSSPEAVEGARKWREDCRAAGTIMVDLFGEHDADDD